MGSRKAKIQLYNKNRTKDQILNRHGDYILDSICAFCRVQENLRTTEYYLDADFILDDEGLFKHIEEDAVLKVQMDYGYEIFSIVDVRKTTSRVVVFARHITITETICTWLEDVRPEVKNGQEALNHMEQQGDGKHNLEFESDISLKNTAFYQKKTLYEAIHLADNCFTLRWGGEIRRRGYKMIVNEKLGKNNGVQIRSGKNLTGFEAVTNIDSIITRIKPIGFNGITIDGFVDSPLINNYKYIRTQAFKYEHIKLASDVEQREDTGTSTDKEESKDLIFDTLQEAQNKLTELALLEYLNGIDVLQASYSINFIELSKTEEYKNYAQAELVELGDEIQVYEEKHGINITVRAIRREYDVLSQRTVEIELTNRPNERNDISDPVRELGSRLDSVVEEIGYIHATYAKVKDLEVTNLDVENLTAEVAKIDSLKANKADVEELTAEVASVKDLKADKATVNELTANVAKIDNLKANKADVEELTAEVATIKDLKADKAEVDTIIAGQAGIIELKANKADVDQLTSEVATIKDLKADKAEVDNLHTKYANIDFANIGEAAIRNFYATSGIIKDLVISDGFVTGNLVGVTIKGDLIEGGTVVADKLVIKGEDGLYYKINTDGEKTESEQTDYNSINGNVITAHSITATKINVDDLVAFDATIGGFNITDSSIYSGVKKSVDNGTRGVYLDKEGQVAFGDSANFLKYYRNPDGTYRLEISADSITFGSKKRNIEAVLNETEETANNANAIATDTQQRVSVTESSLKVLSDSISSLIVDENGKSLMTQTSKGWTFNMSEINNTINNAAKELSNLSGDVNEFSNTLSGLDGLIKDLSQKTAYIVMSTDDKGNPCIELGKENNDFRVRITNTAIEFMEGTNKIAYVNNQSLYIEKAVIKNELQIGESPGWVFAKRSNGNLGLRWKGSGN